VNDTQKPVVVALAETLRGADADAVAAVSPRIKIAWVTPSGEARDDVSQAEVLYRGGGMMPPGLRRLLPLMPNLRWVHSMGAGMDGDLTPEIKNGDIQLSRTRGLHCISVSEWVLMQILAVSKRLPELVLAQHRHEWSKVEVPASLMGRTVGIVGYGEIGQAVAARAKGFGFRLAGTRRRALPAPELDALYPADQLDRLLAESDYVVILTPLTAETRGLIGAAQLKMMKRTAWLINVARGPVVVEADLIAALEDGTIAGAALDVFDKEPLPSDNPLWGLPNVLLSPHTSGINYPRMNDETMAQFLDNLGRYLRGEPLKNLVDKQAGY
jgi:phosphoglycerate dehydrogenase-like enzyme